jgi:hypothetical protein
VQLATFNVIRKMNDFISALTKAYNDTNPPNRLEHKLRGSIAEDTRSGPPNEFDYMLAYTVTKPVEEITEVESINNVRNIRRILDGILKKSPDMWKDTPFKPVRCEPKSVRIKLELLYCSPIFKHMMIDVDLVPVVPSTTKAVYSWSPWLENIFTGCQFYYMHCHKRTYTDYEEALMKSLPKAAVEAYIVSKALRSPLILDDKLQSPGDPDWDVNSYDVKLGLLFCYGQLILSDSRPNPENWRQWPRSRWLREAVQTSMVIREGDVDALFYDSDSRQLGLYKLA